LPDLIDSLRIDDVSVELAVGDDSHNPVQPLDRRGNPQDDKANRRRPDQKRYCCEDKGQRSSCGVCRPTIRNGRVSALSIERKVQIKRLQHLSEGCKALLVERKRRLCRFARCHIIDPFLQALIGFPLLYEPRPEHLFLGRGDQGLVLLCRRPELLHKPVKLRLYLPSLGWITGHYNSRSTEPNASDQELYLAQSPDRREPARRDLLGIFVHRRRSRNRKPSLSSEQKNKNGDDADQGSLDGQAHDSFRRARD
jgi:hypothetical protein